MNRVPKAFHDNVEPFKTSHEARRDLRKVDYCKITPEHIRRSLSHLLREDPVEVYTIALDLLRSPRKPLPTEFAEDIEDIARSAARSSLLNCQLDSWTPEMFAKKDDYERFIDYHRQCRARLVASLVTGELMEIMGTHWIWYNTGCGVCSPIPKSNVVSDWGLEAGDHPATWWATYWERNVTTVGDSPCEKALENERIWESILRALATECPECHEIAARQFPLFKEKLSEMVAKIINGVRTLFIDRFVGQKANYTSNRLSWRSNCNIHFFAFC